MTVIDQYGAERLAQLRTRAGLPAVRERRDPTSATKVLGWTSPGMPMAAEWDAETSIRWGYMANVIAYRCIQIRARALAGCPFRVGPRQPDRPGETVDFSLDAPLARLLGPPPGGPAPKLTARRLIGWSVVQRIATGRHAWEIEANTPGGRPVALWPLVSSQLEPVPTEGGAAWWAGFYYGHGDNRRRLTADQVLYGWDPSATDFRQAESPLQAARLDLSIAVMGDRYSHAFLKNDARPAAIIVHEAFADDDEYVAWKRQFLAEHQGPDNAGRMAFAEAEGGEQGVKGAIDVKVLGLSQKDAQFIQTHQASLERVAMALGVPWSRLDASGRTFDNASEEDEIFWMDQWSFASDLADEINMQLAPRLGREVGWFDMSHVRVFKPKQKFTTIDVGDLLTLGVITPNDVLTDLGYQPRDGGDTPLEPPAPLALPPARTASPPIPAEEGAPATAVRVGQGAPPSRGRERRAMSAEEMEIRRTKIWKRADATVRTLEARWRNAFTALFAKQAKATVSRLEGNRGRKITDQRASVEGIFDRQHWTTETAEAAEALYELVVTYGFARVGDLFAIDFDLDAEWAQDFIRNRANQLAGQVTDTTYQQIVDALAAGAEQGEAIPELAERIKHVFDVASDARATTIARTEVISAYNGSATLAAQQLPADVAAGREWIATRDQRTREDHAGADGQVVAMDAPFDVGGEALVYPGDPAGDPANTVNCRCTVAILTPAEMAERAARGEKRIPVEHAFGVLVATTHFVEPTVRRALEVAA